MYNLFPFLTNILNSLADTGNTQRNHDDNNGEAGAAPPPSKLTRPSVQSSLK